MKTNRLLVTVGNEGLHRGEFNIESTLQTRSHEDTLTIVTAIEESENLRFISYTEEYGTVGIKNEINRIVHIGVAIKAESLPQAIYINNNWYYNQIY